MDLQGARIVGERKIESPRTVIFVPGSWSVANSGKVKVAGDAIVERGLASVIHYESFRDWDALKSASTTEEWIRAFDYNTSGEERTYNDEIITLARVIEYARQDGAKEIFLSGHSFGGSLAALVAGMKRPEVSKVLLTAPQILRKEEDRDNIYKRFPKVKTFAEAMRRYMGSLTIVHPDKDLQTMLRQGLTLYDNSGSNDKRHVIIPGDHGFSGDAQEGYVREHLIAFGK